MSLGPARRGNHPLLAVNAYRGHQAAEAPSNEELEATVLAQLCTSNLPYGDLLQACPTGHRFAKPMARALDYPAGCWLPHRSPGLRGGTQRAARTLLPIVEHTSRDHRVRE